MNRPRGLVIEGVSGIGKTCLLRSLQIALAERRPGSTSLFLSEHYTERVLEDLRAQSALTRADILEHVETCIMPIIEGTVGMQSNSKFDGRDGTPLVRIIIERWVGGMFANLAADRVGMTPRDATANARISSNLSRLRELGITVVVLYAENKHLFSLVRSTLSHRNTKWAQYLDRLEKEHGDIGRYFSTWQDSLCEHYRNFESSHIRFVEITHPLDDNRIKLLTEELYCLLDHTRGPR
jgi:hypothetical protein